MVAVIIPAYNEEQRIGSVLKAVKGAKLAHEIIVVTDGCSDRTAEVARQFPGIKVVELTQNVGKGGAMRAGVDATQADIVAFVDADLMGLRGEHVDQIIRPMMSATCDMCIGVFRGGKFWSDTAQRISPYISGQRAMKRSLFLAVPNLRDQRMGVEVSINTHARRVRARIVRVILRGVSNYHKEQKMGLVKGSQARFKMYAEISRAMMQSQNFRSNKKVRPLLKSYFEFRRTTIKPGSKQFEKQIKPFVKTYLELRKASAKSRRQKKQKPQWPKR